jgi:hypothetical protein
VELFNSYASWLVDDEVEMLSYVVVTLQNGDAPQSLIFRESATFELLT